jgi:5-methylcytosine-specific restriction endonuclease McrA
MNRYLSESLRYQVSIRAGNLREYCLIDIADTFFGGEVDHIVSVKHGGTTEVDNLAYTCQP